MNMRRTTHKLLITLFNQLNVRPLTTLPQLPQPTSIVNPNHLLRVCTVLYQQQNSPEVRLQTHLRACEFHLTHEFFLQVCNKFPLSWRPVYKFFEFTETQPCFHHNSVTFNKMVDVIGRSRNIKLFWEVLQEMGRRRLANDKTFVIALKTLASIREMKKCVEFFHLMNAHEYGYSLETLNKVVEVLCRSKLAVEAKEIVLKLKTWIPPSGVTYGYLIKGFCEVGDLIEAANVWDLMVDEGFRPGIDAVEKMMETLFNINRFDEAMKLFQAVRTTRFDELVLSTYSLVIDWMCKRGKVSQAYMVFEEMLKRGIQPDNKTMSSLIYGLLAKGRVREANKITEGIERPDIAVYHGVIKGLLRLRKAGEATQVFREMIRRGWGLIKVGKSLDASKYVERMMDGGMEVPRFDYNRFLHCYSNEEGVFMFEEVGKKLREVGLVDLADIFLRYGEKMATRDRRRNRVAEPLEELLRSQFQNGANGISGTDQIQQERAS
ncbi:putative pentatricopeptide repeat-containing protein [Vitis vinifera]|uniref:Putative pentatricopeptide repeat-containing protein n=1 Tax=Vitis vinifera TaxID=29760 RepID=A0A438E3D4_VITVI|nr:putative pentatricopeptide repeat-containing protein [Vitis vinifera]